MEEKQEYGIMFFLGNEIFWGVISATWYRNLLFRCIGRLTYQQSMWMLTGVLLCAVLGGLLIFSPKRRSVFSLVTMLSLAYGVYTILAYWHTDGGRGCCVLLISLILAILYSLFVMTRRIRRRLSMRKVMRHRFRWCLESTVHILGTGMLFLLVSMAMKTIFGTGLFQANVQPMAGSSEPAQTITSNFETVCKVKEEIWGTLNTQERLDVMQTVANIEAHYLGLPNELNVGASNLEENTLASYEDRTHTIYIDLDHIEKDPALCVLDSCCHEAYHSYQYRMVEAYSNASKDLKTLKLFQKAAVYGQEFNHYVDGEDDPGAYYFQACEADARSYAKSAVRDYVTSIQKGQEGTDEPKG